MKKIYTFYLQLAVLLISINFCFGLPTSGLLESNALFKSNGSVGISNFNYEALAFNASNEKFNTLDLSAFTSSKINFFNAEQSSAWKKNSKNILNKFLQSRLFGDFNSESIIIIDCPTNISTVVDSGICGAVVNYVAPTSDIGTMQLIAGLSSGSEFPVGLTTVTYEELDGVGSATGETCSFNVTVVDNEAPVITLTNSNPQILEACGTYVENGATAFDNCSGDITGNIVIDASAVNTAVVGSYAVTYNVTDANSNVAVQVTRTVNVVDTTAPTITLAGANPQIIEACGTYTELGAAANDPCIGDITGSILIDTSAVNTAVVGSYTVTYNVTDANSNVAVQVTRTVNVVDTTAPTITLAGANPQIIEACGTYNELGATANDPCFGDISLSIVINAGSVNTNVVGTYTVTYNVTDANTNVGTQVTRTINVIDSTNPILAAAPNALSVQCITNVPALTSLAWTDNCVSGGTVLGVDSALIGGACGGTITRTWNVMDANGNAAVTRTQLITIKDTTKPVIAAAPIAITVDCIDDVPVMINLAWTDNCDTGGSVIGVDSAITGTACNGTITRTWNIADACGNNAVERKQIITIRDNIKPVIAAAPGALSVQCLTDVPAITSLAWTDNCDSGGTVLGVDSSIVGTTCNGKITRTWNVTDACGNVAITRTQIITIKDDTKPTASNPLPIVVQCGSDVPAVDVSVVTDEADNCSIPVVAFVSDVSFGSNPRVITRTYSVTDSCGNFENVKQTITVKDTTPPVASCKPAFSITLDASGSATITVADIDNGSSDNCGTPSLALNTYNFDCDDLGPKTVRLTVTDGAGNQTFCETIVTVLDPAANATVSIVSNDSDNKICNGDSITFTATPNNGGTTPIYEWFVDGTSVGNNDPNFTPISPLAVGTHPVYVKLRSSLSACVNPKPSNIITVTVNPLPTVSGPAGLCVGNTAQLTPNASGWVLTSGAGFATVTSNGLVTGVSSGTAVFTYTNPNGCSSSVSTTINALPVITAPATVCVNGTATLSPNSGGVWTSNSPTKASVTANGIITGIAAGTATFKFISDSGCVATTSVVQVLAIPVISSVIASPTPICVGDNSILTATVAGAGISNVVLANYNFNFGSGYGPAATSGGLLAPGITSSLNSDNISYDRSQNGRTATAPPAFAANVPGKALRQFDSWEDGYVNWYNDPGGFPDDGDWTFTLGGSALSSYQNFQIYFDANRQNTGGKNKTITVEYSTNNGTTWNLSGVRLLNNGQNINNWYSYSATLSGVTNPNNLKVRLSVDDGSTYRGRFYKRYDRQIEPHVLIDNFQVQASITGAGFDYNWSVVSGDTASLPATNTTPQITVSPTVTTEYQVSVANANGCPATKNVTVTVKPAPVITFSTLFCPNAPHGNEVEITAISSIPGTTWQWNITYPNPGDSDYTHGGHSNTSPYAYVDTAGTYQVIATSPNGCSISATIDIATELVTNGDFTNYTPGDFVTEYNVASNYYNGNNGSGLYPEGRYAVDVSAYGESDGTPQGYHPNFHGRDHTNNASGPRNFLMVNGSTTEINPPGPEGPRQRIIWQQTVTVEPGTNYYFSAYAMNLNPASPARLQFEVNGALVGSVAELSAAPTPTTEGQVNLSNWVRFYSTPTWASGTNTTAVIRIRNLSTAQGGNDFALDDISFGSLDPFVKLTSDPGTDNQIICQNTAIENINYDVGGASNGADIQWQLNGVNLGTGPFPNNVLPDGILTNFDGLKFIISGTPIQFGTYTYTMYAGGSCGTPKTATGKIVVNQAPIVTINTLAQTVCQSVNTIALQATLSGSATGGTWYLVGTPDTSIATTISGSVASATYTIGTITGTAIFKFVSNNPTAPCLAAEKTVTLIITPYIIASVGTIIPPANCSASTVTLAGNNVPGQWTAVPNTGYFSNAAIYNSNFTGESGQTYVLTWTATNASPCLSTSATVNVTIPDCGDSLAFDGADDNISFGDKYPMDAGAFSIEAWVKADNTNGTKTIISKRNAAALTTGYDLSLVGNNLRFRYNNNQITANQAMSIPKWYHVAVTFDGSDYNLYIDGFVVKGAIPGLAPIANNNKALIGAMDQSNNAPTNFFKGIIDEVRIWKTALTQIQIQEMMNQEIKANGTNVMGEVVTTDISGGLQWGNLIGYYQMNTGAQTVVANGSVKDISTDALNVPGRLNGMTSMQAETAPIPYISIADNAWDVSSTWSAGDVQQIPNSKVNSITGDEQTWNIVRTNTNVTANRPINLPTRTTVLGLLVDSNTLSIQGDQPLYVDKYLKINGTLDLVGESQLIQPMGSIVDETGIGKLERDQQGTSNKFNYNYWGSPVHNLIGGGNPTFALGSVLYDGSDLVNWNPAQTQIVTNNPVTLSSRWLYLYANLTGTYIEWQDIDQYFNIPVGLGFTMKGSGVATANQNYTFAGAPNNGDINTTISANNQVLVGNPYPSAIDSHKFIDDNATASLDGTLTFWEQAPANNSHVLAAYLGRYSYYNKIGGASGATPPGEIAGGGNANKLPGRFVPVGQGFFITGDTNGGQINFNNSQRIFKKEANGVSVFLRNGDTSGDTQTDDVNTDIDQIQRVRLGIKSPEGATRHLLLGFTTDNDATDAPDYGYDGLNSDDFPSDASFKIEDKNYVIQGVGAFATTKQYPFALKLAIAGPVEFALTDLENFDTNPDVYVYDSVLGTYHSINDTSFVINLEPGTYDNRFFLTFEENQTLTVIDNDFKDITVKYLQGSNQIYIQTPGSINVKQVYLISIAGQVVKAWNTTNTTISHEMRIPVKDVSEGNYVIKIETDTNSFNKKVIVKY